MCTMVGPPTRRVKETLGVPTYVRSDLACFVLGECFYRCKHGIEKDGIDPDVVELTPKEMGRRMSYDQQNDLLHRRRSTIRAKMSELGLSAEMARDVEDEPPNEGRHRLSLLVLGKLPSDIPEAAAEIDDDEEGAIKNEE